MGKTGKVNKIVLAYSGGLDTSVILRWLKETYDTEVVAFAADVGQGEELAPIREKALRTGASKVYIEDLREDFVREWVFPAVRANAVYEGTYLLGTSLARPLIAKRHIEIAEKEGADAVAHGATGKGNDQIRFELTYYALKPDIKVIAPWREWEFKSRTDLIGYAKKHGIPVPVTIEKPFSTDRNLMHMSFEGGVLEDPWADAPDDTYVLTVPPEKAPDKPSFVEIDFEQGTPVAVDGKTLSPAKLLERLNELGGANAVGRIDMVENRFVGMKSRGIYETPGGTILHAAHRALETITMDREVMRIRDSLIPKYAELIYCGFSYAPEMRALQALVDESQVNVTGTVRMKLYKGNAFVMGRKSEHSLYSPELATFEKDAIYNQADADGFIKLHSLRLRIRSLLGK